MMMIVGVLLFCLGAFIAGQNTQSKIAWPLIVLGLVLFIMPAHGRDLGQWENSDPVIRKWFDTLMRPDAPEASCCGVADAYWADEVHVREDSVTHKSRTFATITDDRPDEPLGRPHVDVGTEIEVPPEKLKWDRANPTGHAVIFLSRERFVWCFVQGTGI